MFYIRNIKNIFKAVAVNGKIFRNLSASTYRNNNIDVKPILMSFTSYESESMTEDSLKNSIIIIHGLLGSKNNWNLISKRLLNATGIRIIAVDLRNHGESEHVPEISYDHMISDCVLLLEKLKLINNQVHLLGHSMGGRVAMYLALEKPDLVKSLIIVDISPLSNSSDLSYFPKLFKVLQNVQIDSSLILANGRKQAENQLKLFITDKWMRDFILTNLIKDKTSGNFIWKFNLDSLMKNINKLNNFPSLIVGKKFNKPTLFIAGKESNYMKMNEEENILKIFTKAEFRYIEDAGHLVHIDKPQEFIDTAVKYVNKQNKH